MMADIGALRTGFTVLIVLLLGACDDLGCPAPTRHVRLLRAPVVRVEARRLPPPRPEEPAPATTGEPLSHDEIVAKVEADRAARREAYLNRMIGSVCRGC